MRAKRIFLIGLPVLVCWLVASCILPPAVSRNSPEGLLMASVDRLASAVEPQQHQTLHARLRIVEGEGLAKSLAGQDVEFLVQPPERLLLKAAVSGKPYQLGRNGQEFWIYAAEKKFCLVGRPDVPRFDSRIAMNPGGAPIPVKFSADAEAPQRMGPLHLPVSRFQLSYLPRFVDVKRQADESVGTNRCLRLDVTAKPDAIQKHHLPKGKIELAIRESDHLPMRISYTDERGQRVTVEAVEMGFENSAPASTFAFTPSDGDNTERVALSHLTTFLASRWSTLNKKIPTLKPATGERRIIATEGEGRLELHDGARVLFLKGSPEQMGRQHGALMQNQIKRQVRDVLYGMGIASALAKGTWFFGEMENAELQLLPHMDSRYLREMDALADAAHATRAEIRMANFFPELFHCSGFALYGDATVGGKLYHGRILDYFRGQGLEQNAVVIVSQPDYGHAWVNVSYAGFIGSVTAMNEKRIAIGEMGGHGEGQWDGKPMAQLVREVMEQADTIDEAVEIMRRGPRTCEYYYVISDGNSRRAVAIHATPTEFETVWAGESHPMLPEAIKDAVCVSGGKRFTELIRRIKEGYGTFDSDSARDLMKRPVSMKSNIHCALFAPETLDFWVANADSRNEASNTRYTHYNLEELLRRPPAQVNTARK